MPNKVTKHMELTINLGSYQSQKIGNSIELEQQEGETMAQLQQRSAYELNQAMLHDIISAFVDDPVHRRIALAMIGVQGVPESFLSGRPATAGDADEGLNNHPF